MGSEATSDYCGDGTTASSPQGLIPRFVEDLFARLQQHQQQQQPSADGQGQQQREANVRGCFVCHGPANPCFLPLTTSNTIHCR